MARVIPVPLLSLFTGFELETMVCGSPDIPLHLLKSVATYKGVIIQFHEIFPKKRLCRISNQCNLLMQSPIQPIKIVLASQPNYNSTNDDRCTQYTKRR